MNRRRIKINFFSSRLVAIIGLFIIIYASIGLAKITWQNYKINQKISSLEKELKEMEEENFELKNKILYYRTNAYKERLAREKLNLQKPGEIVVVIPDNLPTTEKKEKTSSKEPKKETKKNYQKWWDYFFGPSDNNQ